MSMTFSCKTHASWASASEVIHTSGLFMSCFLQVIWNRYLGVRIVLETMSGNRLWMKTPYSSIRHCTWLIFGHASQLMAPWRLHMSKAMSYFIGVFSGLQYQGNFSLIYSKPHLKLQYRNADHMFKFSYISLNKYGENKQMFGTYEITMIIYRQIALPVLNALTLDLEKTFWAR